MTSRRRFIQGMAALAPGLTLGEASGASPDDEKCAAQSGGLKGSLVVRNSCA